METWQKVLIGAGVVGAAGVGYVMYRRSKTTGNMSPDELPAGMPPLPEEPYEPDDLDSDMITAFVASPGRTASTTSSSTLHLDPTFGAVRVKVLPAKYEIRYDENDYTKDDRLRKLFKQGELISFADGQKFMSGFGGVVGTKGGFIVASSPSDIIASAGNLAIAGHGPDGIKSPTIANKGFGDTYTVTMPLPPGKWYISTPTSIYAKAKPGWYITGYWKMTKSGPRHFTEDEIKAKMYKGECYNTLTKPNLSAGGLALKSMKLVTVVTGKTIDVSVTPIIRIYCSKEKKQTTKSVIFRGFCEAYAFVGGKMPENLMDLLGLK